MVESILSSDFPKQAIIVIISMIPVVELRGAIPIATGLLNMHWHEALYLSIIGNLIPVPFILLLLESVSKLVSRVEIGRRFVEWLFARTRKHSGIIEKYQYMGLMLFVAIPLPFTGAWTGALAAFLLGLKFYKAFIAIAGGVIIAGFIITALSLIGWIGAVIIGIALVALASVGWWKI
ncbi:COG2426 family protein [Chloroflexota bacterium]